MSVPSSPASTHVFPRNIISASMSNRRLSANQLFASPTFSSPTLAGGFFLNDSNPTAALETALSPSTSSPVVTDLLSASRKSVDGIIPPVTASMIDGHNSKLVTLELKDGTLLQGYSFGAHKSVSGEFVFQTGEYFIWINR